MLTLTRKAGQRIQIGDEIVVHVREVRGGHVKIGVSAPRSWLVYRGELYDAIQAENLAATSVDVADLTAALGGLSRGASPKERPDLARAGGDSRK